MKKRGLALLFLLLILLSVFCACEINAPFPEEALASATESRETLQSIAENSEASKLPEESQESASSEPVESFPSFRTVDEDGEYSSTEEVALYIHLYHKLPANYITKTRARELGWKSGGNLWKAAPGKSIGGDRFGNYEKRLPKGIYYECDVNYSGGSRGAERLVYNKEGAVYYTDDHYENFVKLY